MPFTQLRSGSVMVVVFTTLMRQPYRESGLVHSAFDTVGKHKPMTAFLKIISWLLATLSLSCPAARRQLADNLEWRKPRDVTCNVSLIWGFRWWVDG